MSLFWFAIITLTTWSLTRIWIGNDRFPPAVYVMDQLRRIPWFAPGRPWAGLLGCAWCSSYWIALGVIFVVDNATAAVQVPIPLVIALAVRVIVGLLEDASQTLDQLFYRLTSEEAH